jgi:hypothetical protein
MKKALTILRGSLLLEALPDKEPQAVEAMKFRDKMFQKHSISGENIDKLFSAFKAIWEVSPPHKEAADDEM